MNKGDELKVSYTAGRNAAREHVQKHMRALLLCTEVSVGVVDLVFAYRHRSVSDGVVAVLVWFILAPIISVWRTRK
ncbi:MAG: hypothetical protein WAN60_15390 [Candidatus Sulfotelmatobacter sp.]